MHQYLRAVGFSEIETKKQLNKLLNDVIVQSNKKEYLEKGDDSLLTECTKYYSQSTGITLRGEYDDAQNLNLDFYYPVVMSDNISTIEELGYERHTDKSSYAGICEDIRVGVSLIFFMQNGLYLMKQIKNDTFDKNNIATSLSGLSLGGTIMLPIQKDEKQKDRIRKASADRNKRIMAAKNGDEEAIEQLTLEDIDTYSAISRRVLKDDVFTLVDSYFMPYGVECDHYSLLGEIDNFHLETNTYTGEKIYILECNCNSLPITVCINAKDLLGEPQIGRRFRGNIWLQGQIGI